MTREEMLSQLGAIRDHCKSMITEDEAESVWSRDVEALDMAISAIRQETKVVEIDHVKPLTLDELREMDGEPVWVRHGNEGEWAIVRWNAFDAIAGSLRDVFFKHEYGVAWTAYRQKVEAYHQKKKKTAARMAKQSRKRNRWRGR